MSTPSASSLSKPRTQMQTITRTDMVVIEIYYHMTKMDEHELDETKTSTINFSLNLKNPSYMYTFTSKFLTTSSNVHIGEK